MRPLDHVCFKFFIELLSHSTLHQCSYGACAYRAPGKQLCTLKLRVLPAKVGSPGPVGALESALR
jgi:hypothetical protein